MSEVLVQVLRRLQPLAIAISGGVDSLTLAHFALRNSIDATLFHARSAAVPSSAQARLSELPVVFVDAGELEDEQYIANPSDRCFYCKTHLYSTLRRVAPSASTICSGTNLDDLDDWRPGLRAAAEHGVVHPFVEVGMRKADVRALASSLGLPELAALPASPCLSSRIETGVRIDAHVLAMVDSVETMVRAHGIEIVRCRIRSDHVVIELGEPANEAALRSEILPLIGGLPLSFAPYRRGSAFLRVTE